MYNIFRNAETWFEEQRRRLRWLRAKSLDIYNPEKNTIDRLLSNQNNVPSNQSIRSSSKSRKRSTKTNLK